MYICNNIKHSTFHISFILSHSVAVSWDIVCKNSLIFFSIRFAFSKTIHIHGLLNTKSLVLVKVCDSGDDGETT